MKVAVINEFGPPEVIKITNRELDFISSEEVRIKQKSIGLNYIDIYYRNGLYKAELPAILGFEACGIVEESNAKEFQKGDRIAYVTAPMGAYSEFRNINSSFLVPVPTQVSDIQASAVIFKAMTAHFLLNNVAKIKPGMTILIHAAAGGVGHFLVEMAKFYQLYVIGTVGNDEKARIAYSLGCDYVINYSKEDIAAKVLKFTNGQGVDIVYDAVGKNTFKASLDSLKLFGLMVSYGQASGDITDFNLRMLTEKSLFITRPTIFKYNNKREDLLRSAREVFDMLIHGHIRDNIKQIYKFDEIVKAHHDLENRKNIGSSVIII